MSALARFLQTNVFPNDNLMQVYWMPFCIALWRSSNNMTRQRKASLTECSNNTDGKVDLCHVLRVKVWQTDHTALRWEVDLTSLLLGALTWKIYPVHSIKWSVSELGHPVIEVVPWQTLKLQEILRHMSSGCTVLLMAAALQDLKFRHQITAVMKGLFVQIHIKHTTHSFSLLNGFSHWK